MKSNPYLEFQSVGWKEGDDFVAFHDREEWMKPYRRRLRFLAAIMYFLGCLLFMPAVIVFTTALHEAFKVGFFTEASKEHELAMLFGGLFLFFGATIILKAQNMWLLKDGFQNAAAIMIFFLSAPSIIFFITLGVAAISAIYSDKTKEVIASEARKRKALSP